jgi:hypothetical protein
MTSDVPPVATFFIGLMPRADREAIVGDLVEEADFRNLSGLGRSAWLVRECGEIALGLSIDRLRRWFVMPPIRELVTGVAVDGRSAFRSEHPLMVLGRAALFCGSVATLVLGVEVLVGSLLSASGF